MNQQLIVLKIVGISQYNPILYINKI